MYNGGSKVCGSFELTANLTAKPPITSNSSRLPANEQSHKPAWEELLRKIADTGGKIPSDLTVDPPASIRLLGPMTSKDAYGTFLDLLRHARTEICLPMLATPAYPVTAAILQERTRRNVHVRLLLASPDVAAKVRGGAIVEKARKAITEWKDVAQSHLKIEVRICHYVDDMCYLATPWTLDRHLLRYDIYDPKQQLSLTGYMIEFESRSGLDLNIVNWFQSRFYEAWKKASP